ncbi:hypothetical protein UFOVP1624_3 [uncultured Caudovirales phage]|uniref:Uncharacterized protein n=1 Tax=uncultured Caudovirales phage TaxID=2100421 RepID=A0A6J5SWV9_9CAUD|nr:hypothetical protein UFOVP1624_3 [uncultured Caudovirales phage]
MKYLFEDSENAERQLSVEISDNLIVINAGILCNEYYNGNVFLSKNEAIDLVKVLKGLIKQIENE